MVVICPSEYPKEKETEYASSFENYPFELSSFQKWAIQAIVTGHHVLATAHTGSGKTLPAEFAIRHVVQTLGKKVIYTSPIKALSNQKFHEFTAKFPDISFGLLTGDIKVNPAADVIIMTAEILMNKLITQHQTMTAFSFDINLETELGAVVIDEAHYINDAERGGVWETTIIQLPLHVQLVMLSATLDSPQVFAGWVEARDKTATTTRKQVYLCSTHERVVPLTHYCFLTCTQGLFKVLKDKALEKEITQFCNKTHVLQRAKGVFQEATLQSIRKYLKLFSQKNHYVKRQHVMNQLCKHLVEKEMLPALCFVMSRKAVDQCAQEVTTNLLEFDSKVPYIVRNECEQILRSKLANFGEYLRLPEYLTLVGLLEKGIATHHAGMMPILRELVELMFAKGYVKLLFATESMAIGVNMPVRTTVFTDATKFDGHGSRMFYSHEYTQMAGRAGRRGIDQVGHVIHLSNLFRSIDSVAEYKAMMRGVPQTLVSKFKISYHLLLIQKDDIVSGSMIQLDLERQQRSFQRELEKIQEVQSETEENAALTEFVVAEEARVTAVNSRRKELDRVITGLKETHGFTAFDKDAYIERRNLRRQRDTLLQSMEQSKRFVECQLSKVRCLLTENGFLCNEEPTLKGQVAAHLKELHCLVFADWLVSLSPDNHLTSVDLVSIFSCFAGVTVPDELRSTEPSSCVSETKELTNAYQRYQHMECRLGLDTGTQYEIQFDLQPFVRDWCLAQDEAQCKAILQQMEAEKEVFLGEFVKAILKINNMSAELECVAEMLGDLVLLQKLREIPGLTLKFVATNQSLYI